MNIPMPIKKVISVLTLIPILSVSQHAFAADLPEEQDSATPALIAGSAVASYYTTVFAGGNASNAFKESLNHGTYAGLHRTELDRLRATPKGARSPEALALERKIQARETAQKASLARSVRLRRVATGGTLATVALVGAGLISFVDDSAQVSGAAEKKLPSGEGASLAAELAEARGATAAR